MKKRMIGTLGMISLIAIVTLSSAGCAKVHMSETELTQKLVGLSVNIRTFDEESNVIDKVTGKSVSIVRDSKFDSSNENKDSSVLKITIGKSEISHVGSSLIMAEDSLSDIFDEYYKTVDIENSDRSIPIINRIVNGVLNDTVGKEKTILIRSQSGKPLATYVGNSVSSFSVDIPNTTAFLIDGKMLLVYRCDFITYDTALLLEK